MFNDLTNRILKDWDHLCPSPWFLCASRQSAMFLSMLNLFPHNILQVCFSMCHALPLVKDLFLPLPLVLWDCYVCLGFQSLARCSATFLIVVLFKGWYFAQVHFQGEKLFPLCRECCLNAPILNSPVSDLQQLLQFSASGSELLAKTSFLDVRKIQCCSMSIVCG